MNVDIAPPKLSRHLPHWRKQDILDLPGLTAAFGEFRPDWVVHLAARTDVVENVTVEEGYRTNISGTRNVVNLVAGAASVDRLVITSTQYVRRPGGLPRDDEDYDPHTVYGLSKVESERITRSSDLNCIWTIIRPTNIWGPWHERYRDQFFLVLEKGLYFHPRGANCVKSYGYVANVAEQIWALLNAPPEKVDRKTLYVGDPPINLREWVDGFSIALTGRRARSAPRAIYRTLAALGDVLSRVRGKPFLITTSRYRNMLMDYPTPMEATFEILGPPKYTLEEGIAQTVHWLRDSRNEGSAGH